MNPIALCSPSSTGSSKNITSTYSSRNNNSRFEIILLLENPSKSNNLGPIIRCATAFGIETIVLIGYSKCSTVGSHGASKYVNMIDFPTPIQAVQYLKKERNCTSIIGLLGTGPGAYNDNGYNVVMPCNLENGVVEDNDDNKKYSLSRESLHSFVRLDREIHTRSTNVNNKTVHLIKEDYVSSILDETTSRTIGVKYHSGRSYPVHSYPFHKIILPDSTFTTARTDGTTGTDRSSNDENEKERQSTTTQVTAGLHKGSQETNDGNVILSHISSDNCICIVLSKDSQGLPTRLAVICDNFIHVPHADTSQIVTTQEPSPLHQSELSSLDNDNYNSNSNNDDGKKNDAPILLNIQSCLSIILTELMEHLNNSKETKFDGNKFEVFKTKNQKYLDELKQQKTTGDFTVVCNKLIDINRI